MVAQKRNACFPTNTNDITQVQVQPKPKPKPKKWPDAVTSRECQIWNSQRTKLCIEN